MRFNFSLSTKINLIIFLAVLLPLLLVSGLLYQAFRGIALNNYESFILESGSRQQARIEVELQTAQSLLNDYLAANEDFILASIEQRNNRDLNAAATSIRNSLEVNFRVQLLDSDYFTSVTLLSPQYFTYAGVASGQQLEDDTGQRSSISETAVRLTSNPNDKRALIISQTEAEEIPRIEILTEILGFTEEGEQQAQGFLLVELNLETIFLQHLRTNTTEIATYSFMLIESGGELFILADSELKESNIIDTGSLASTRALSVREGAVQVYDISGEDGFTEVMGYSATLQFEEQNFGLVEEVSTAILLSLLTETITAQVFVIAIVATVVILVLSLLATNQLVIPPIIGLRSSIQAVIRGDFESPVPESNREDEIGELATSFVDMREYIRDLTEDMNRKLRDRTRDVQVTQQIASAMTDERDLNELMRRVVMLIVQNFPSIYHAQIFLVDDDRKFAVLRASTGAAGRELLARGHKLAVGSVSVIGQVTEQAQVMIARDTAESTVHRQNEFLGDTRAELAIPLNSAGTVIGALDVQSKLRDSFAPDQVAALQTLADQITIAIDNIRLYAQSQRLLHETEAEQQRATRKTWQEFVRQQRQEALIFGEGATTGYNFDRLRNAVLKSNEPVVGDITGRNTIPFVVPIRLRGQTLGVVEYEVPASDFEYDKVLLAQELVSRLALSLENARLFQASQQATERERIVNTISARLTSQTDIESILKTAVREVEQALRTPRVSIRLAGEPISSGNGNGSSNGNGNHANTNGNSPVDSSQ